MNHYYDALENGVAGSLAETGKDGVMRAKVAVPTGWGGWIKDFAPELYGAPRGHALVVFTLP